MNCKICGDEIEFAFELCVECDSKMLVQEALAIKTVKPLSLPSWDYAEDDFQTTYKTTFTPSAFPQPVPTTGFDGVAKAKVGKKQKAQPKPTASLVQESPYKIWDIKSNIKGRELLEWLREVKDRTFAINLYGEKIFFKSPRDVSNFMLGFHISSEIAREHGISVPW